MSSIRIVVIGGTACGPKAAARAARCDPSAEITIIEQNNDLSTATCGLPYYVSGVIESEERMTVVRPSYFEDVMDMEVMNNTRALSIDREAHTVEVLDMKKNTSSKIEYDKLVIATGSIPAVPKLEGRDLEGIYTLTGLADANAIIRYVADMKSKNAVIVGAGLIGLEMAEALVTKGLKVTILEALDWPLPTLLDPDIACQVEKHMCEKGIEFVFGQRVTGFKGVGKVNSVLYGDSEIEAGLVLLSLGVRPNVELARDAGLTIGEAGGIAVNEYMQTSDPDIYAGGDCVENRHIITGEAALVPMGSTANKHGRIIGTNITGGSLKFPGVLGTAIVKVFDINAGRIGLNETQAVNAGYDIVSSVVTGNEHATYYPGNREFIFKLIAEKSGGKILGGEMAGPGDIAKRIDVLASAISTGTTVDQLADFDLSYAPPFNGAMDPLHNAANVIRNKQAGIAMSVSAAEVKGKIERGDEFILLDVRNRDEWDAVRFDAEQALLLPLPELRWRLDELSADAEIITVCRTSIRAYQAQRILDGAGFRNVRFMDGSITAWPYEGLIYNQ